MSLEQKINDQLKGAMLARDEKKLRALRAIKAAIILAKTAEGSGGKLEDAGEIKLLQKLVKQRKDSLEIYQTQNRPDLAQKVKEEIDVSEEFLPAQMDQGALKERISQIIAELGAGSISDMGKVMASATKQLAGMADGKTIGAMVKELLQK